MGSDTLAGWEERGLGPPHRLSSKLEQQKMVVQMMAEGAEGRWNIGGFYRKGTQQDSRRLIARNDKRKVIEDPPWSQLSKWGIAILGQGV